MLQKKLSSKSSEHVVAIEPLIHRVRGQRVILDSDLAQLYGVSTKVFNQAVKRNQARFPEDFMFRLNKVEFERHISLRSQFVTSNTRRGGVRYLPYAFTENGAVMAANVLNSPSAVRMSVFVVRAFMRMRDILAGGSDIMKDLAELEKRLSGRLDAHETAIVDIVKRMMTLFEPPAPDPQPAKRPIGFYISEGRA